MDSNFLFTFTVLASTEGFLVACALLLGLVYYHCGPRRAVVFLLSAAGLIITVAALKEIVHAARPVGGLIPVTGYAFPSGHAAGAAFIALGVCHLARHHTRLVRYFTYVASFGIALAIGLSRVLFVVHTPLQVAAGFAVGVVWAALFILTDHSETNE